MTTMYAVRNDGYKFKELDLTTMDIVHSAPDNIAIADIVGFHNVNTEMGAWWKIPETKFVNIEGQSRSRLPDICLWTGGSGSSLVLSPRARRLLGDLLKDYGELLPVIVGGETYHIFNCRRVEESAPENLEHEYVDGVEFGLKNVSFKESASELIVFKSPVNGCTSLFCGEQFKNAVIDFSLAGVIFDENLIEEFD